MWMGPPRDRDAGLRPLSVGLGSPRDWGEGPGRLGMGMGSPIVGLGVPRNRHVGLGVPWDRGAELGPQPLGL